MGGIVLELQREAMDKTTDVESLLRRAFLIAKKLKLEKFEDWIRNEQNGYEKNKIPNYRYVKGELKAWNPIRGWIPVVLNNNELEDTLTKVPMRTPISGIIDLYNTECGTITSSINAECNQLLSDMCGFDAKYATHFGKNQLYQIISTVKNNILEWSLILEENKIIGEELTFTEEEKNIAQKTQIINQYVNNFYSNVEDISLQQGNVNE